MAAFMEAKWTDEYFVRDAVNGSAALLKALREHHDFDVLPPRGWRPRTKIADSAPMNSWPDRPIKFSFEEIAEDRTYKIAEIQRAACAYFDISRNDLLSARRSKNIVYARQVTYFVCKELTLRSLPELGRRFGGRDHTTVLHGIRKIGPLVKRDWTVAYDVAHVEAML